MTGAWQVYVQGMKTAIAGRMAYRGDFWISAVMMLAFEMIVPLVTILIYRVGGMFPGWTLYEALLIQGIYLLAKGIAFPFFFGMLWNTLERVREGTFDILLIKPRSVLFLTIATAFDAEDLGKLIGGIALFGVAVSKSPEGANDWLGFALLFVLAVLMLFSFALILSAITFQWVGVSRMYEIFDAITIFGLYPATIFGKNVQTLITAVLPIALLGYLPAAVLLGKPTAPLWPAFVTAVLFALFSLWFYHWMLRKYASAGG